jgi:hypothetical protein
MNKLITLVIAVLALSVMHPAVYADDESKTVIKKSVDVDDPDKEITEEVTKETDDGESTYKRETTIENDDDSSSSTTTTTTTTDD